MIRNSTILLLALLCGACAKEQVTDRFFLNWNDKPWSLTSHGYERCDPVIVDIRNMASVIPVAINKQIRLAGRVYVVRYIANDRVTLMDSHNKQYALETLSDAFNAHVEGNGDITLTRKTSPNERLERIRVPRPAQP
jgi:hypothetical protein